MVLLTSHVKNRIVGGAFVVLFCLLSGMAGVVALTRIASLPYETDYQYYIEFAEKAFVPHATFSESAIVAEGTSILMHGPDGASGIHYGIHFEPVKYVVAMIFAISDSLFTIHMFYIFVFFSPLLYVAWRFFRGEGSWAIGVAVLMYVLAPGAMTVATDSLRPFVLLYPGFFLLMVTLIERRPVYEQLLFLHLLAFSREEGLLYMLLGLSYATLHWFLNGDRSYRIWTLLFNALGWFLIYGLYVAWILPVYEWRSFGFVVSMVGFVTSHAILVSLGVIVTIMAGIYVFRHQKEWVRHFSPSLVLSFGMLVPLFAAPVLGMIDSIFAPSALSGRYGMLVCMTAAVLVVLVWRRRNTRLPTAGI